MLLVYLIIANSSICKFIKDVIQEYKGCNPAIITIYLSPIIGIAYLAGFVGNIIVNSKIILFRDCSMFISTSLTLTILASNLNLFNNIISIYIKEKNKRNIFSGTTGAYWGYVLTKFMISPNKINSYLLLLILLLPTSLEIISNIINSLKS